MQVIGGTGKQYMRKKKIKYRNEVIGEVKIIEDFLPSPNKLIMCDKTVKVTLSLTKESVDFFKKEARTHHTQYQKMIRKLLDRYTDHYRQKRG